MLQVCTQHPESVPTSLKWLVYAPNPGATTCQILWLALWRAASQELEHAEALIHFDFKWPSIAVIQSLAIMIIVYVVTLAVHFS